MNYEKLPHDGICMVSLNCIHTCLNEVMEIGSGCQKAILKLPLSAFLGELSRKNMSNGLKILSFIDTAQLIIKIVS